MKRNLFIAVLLLYSFASFAQDAKEILQKSYVKCQSIQNGYYEMTKFMKFMMSKDTVIGTFNCYFKKLHGDSLYSSAFHYHRVYDGKDLGDVFYTGDDFVTLNPTDSSAEIMAKSQWSQEMKLIKYNYDFYEPLTDKMSYPFINDSGHFERTCSFKFIGEEKILGVSCYHCEVNVAPPSHSIQEGIKTLKMEYHYWINKKEMIPIRYSNEVDVFMNGDTLYQFERFVLNKYELNNLKNDSILTLKSIPPYYKLKTYVPFKAPSLLTKGSMAPDWSLFSLKDEKISLNDFKGKVVLIDFFYKSCYPCMLALPKLEALYEKYKEKGLVVVGIDPVDKKEDDMGSFLSKRGVRYTVLLGGKDVSKDYHISGYPTMYLIDKNGKIVYAISGYGIGVEAILENYILQTL